MNKSNLKIIGPLPHFYAIAEYLWGQGVDVDSDGDSFDPKSTSWTELTLVLREDENQRIDIDPHKTLENTLVLASSNQQLINSVIAFLKSRGSIE